MVTTANGDGHDAVLQGRSCQLRGSTRPDPRFLVPSTMVGSQTTNAPRGQPRHPGGLWNEPAQRHQEEHQPQQQRTGRSPTTARRWRCRGRGTACRPCLPCPRTPMGRQLRLRLRHGKTLRERMVSISVRSKHRQGADSEAPRSSSEARVRTSPSTDAGHRRQAASSADFTADRDQSSAAPRRSTSGRCPTPRCAP